MTPMGDSQRGGVATDTVQELSSSIKIFEDSRCQAIIVYANNARLIIPPCLGSYVLRVFAKAV